MITNEREIDIVEGKERRNASKGGVEEE